MSVPLPPLPGLGEDVFWEPAGRSVIDMLAIEHRRLDALCTWLATATTAERRRQVADVVTATVARHLSAEEQYLYPSVRAVLPDGDQLAETEIAEDRELLRTLRELTATAADGPRFDELVGQITAAIRRHARVSGEVLLPPLRAGVSDTDLVRLGNRLQVAQEAAPTRPHPDAPAAPPWNKVVDPALGLVDKARDLLAGRVTYPDDL
jgi:hypothetical protein